MFKTDEEGSSQLEFTAAEEGSLSNNTSGSLETKGAGGAGNRLFQSSYAPNISCLRRLVNFKAEEDLS